jgi:hypothetical protein
MDAVIGAAGALPVEITELTNLDPALLRAWHPVALADRVGAAPVPVMLAGRLWMVRRISGRVVADPPPYGLRERWGLVWLAAREPLEPLDTPQMPDRRDAGTWLPPVSTAIPASLVAERFFAAQPGVAAQPDVRVSPEPYGFRAVHGRLGYRYRAPFQLLRSVEVPDTGIVRSVLCVVAPEHLTRSQVYTKVLLRAEGRLRPGPAELARELAAEKAVRDQELAAGPPADPGPLGTAVRAELRRLVERTASIDLPRA